jgi:sulfur-carrier protein
MNIQVNLYAAARHAVGQESVTIDASSLNDLRAKLMSTFPELATIVPQCSFLVDGLSHGRDADVQLAPGVRIDVMPPFSGG